MSINTVDKPVDKSDSGNKHASALARDMPKRKGGVIGHKGGNQHTARRADKTARDNAERWQDNPRYTVAALMRKLEAIGDGKIKRSPVQVKALELMLDRLAPRLSAVEQTTIEPAARLSEAEIRAQLADLVANHHGLLQELIADHARASAQAITAASDTQSGDTEHSQPVDNAHQAHG